MTGDIARYTRVAMWLHWVIAALVVVNLTIGMMRGALPGLRGLMPAHKAIGLTVLALTLVRIGWRVAHPAPPLPGQVARWQRTLSHIVHGLLYVLLLAMPVTGWLLVSGGHRRPLSWFGLFAVPYLPVTPATADAGDAAHALLGWLMLALVMVHIGAALYHRLALRDGVLARMAPALERHPLESFGRSE